VPRTTLDRYLAAEVDEIIVSTKLDGLPHRMIRNDVLRRLEQTGPLGTLWMGMKNGFAFRKLTGLSFFGVLKSAIATAKSSGMTLGQTLMAANAPVLIQRAIVEGSPAEGILPSGQVAGAIDDLPRCKELIDRIVAEAEQRLGALGASSATTPV